MNTNTDMKQGLKGNIWKATKKLTCKVFSREYKHLTTEMIFLKSISDSLCKRHRALKNEECTVPEDHEEHRANYMLPVPADAYWSFLQGKADDQEKTQFFNEDITVIAREIIIPTCFLIKDFIHAALPSTWRCRGNMITNQDTCHQKEAVVCRAAGLGIPNQMRLAVRLVTEAVLSKLMSDIMQISNSKKLVESLDRNGGVNA